MDSGALVFVLFLCCSGTWAQNSQSAPTECSLTKEHRADVILLLDGFNHITSEDFSKVTDFLEALVQRLGVVGLDSVRLALVKWGGEPEIEFDLNTYHDVPSVVSAVKRLSQSPPSPGDSTKNGHWKAVFQTDRGLRDDTPTTLILISDRNSLSSYSNSVENWWNVNIKVFIVGVKDTDYSELKRIGNDLDKPKFYTVEDLNGFPNILRELTQSLCHWIKQKLDLVRPETVRFSDVQSRRARVSWTYSGRSVKEFHLVINPDSKEKRVLGHKRSTEIHHLRPNTSYEIQIGAYGSDLSLPMIKRLTTQQDSVRLSAGPSRCSGSLEVHIDQMWSPVCAENFGRAEAEMVCRELDCGGVSDLQGVLFTEGSAVGRSFHCKGAERALKECGSFETCCSAAANITCTDDVTWINGYKCYGSLKLRHQDQWRRVTTVDQDKDLDFGSALCQQLGCGLALTVAYYSTPEAFWILDPECVKQRSGLRDCLRHDSINTQDMNSLWLTCSGHYPALRIAVSSEGGSQSLVHRALVRSGANFSVSCSLDEPFLPVFFHLFSPSGNYTLPSVNHSAHFLFSDFGPAHKGDYICGYSEVESDPIIENVTVSIGLGVPNCHLFLRAGIHVLILFLSTSALFFYCQTTRGQRRRQL